MLMFDHFPTMRQRRAMAGRQIPSFDPPSVRFYDRPADRQADTHPSLLCCEEALEQTNEMVGWDPRAAVLDLSGEGLLIQLRGDGF
jgi:hypothetical protein